MPAIFWNKTTHYFHIPYTYIRFPNEDNFVNKPWSTSNRQKQTGNQDFYRMIDATVAQQNVLKEISVQNQKSKSC